MDELADTFCERCGTRYTFRPAPTPKSQYVGKAKVLARGLRHFVMNDGSSMDEALRAAKIDTGAEEAVRVTEEFHKTFNFCMVCRQYACDKCWNENQGACLSCAPLWDEPAVAPADQLLQRPSRSRSRKGSAPRPTEWPAADVEVAQAQAARSPSRAAPPAPEPELGAFEAAAREASRSRQAAPPQPAMSRRDELIGAPQPPAPAPAPMAPAPAAPPVPSPPPAQAPLTPAPEPAPRADLPAERTPSWVSQKDQDEADQLRATSQAWMSRDDDWALWPTDESPAALPPAQGASDQASADRTPHPRRTPAEPGPAPESADRRRSRAEAASSAPLAYEQAAGTRRPPRPAPQPTVPPVVEPPVPPAPATKRGQRPAAIPDGVDESLGFDLIGSLRTTADVTEPVEAPRQQRTPVVGRILGRKAKSDEPGAAAQPRAKAQPQPKTPLAPKQGPARARDRSAAAEPAWPQPTKWQDRPIAKSEDWVDDVYPAVPPVAPPRQVPPQAAQASFQQPPEPPAFERPAPLPPRQPPARLVAPPPMPSDAALALPPTHVVPPPMPAEAAPAVPPYVPPMPAEAAPAVPQAQYVPPPLPADPAPALPPATTDRWQAPVADLPDALPPRPRPEWQMPESAVDPWSPAPTPRPAPRNIVTPRPLSETPWAQPTPPTAAQGRKGRHEEPPESPLVAELWAESAQQVIDLGTTRVCVACGLPVSTQARFCRRCGSRQD